MVRDFSAIKLVGRAMNRPLAVLRCTRPEPIEDTQMTKREQWRAQVIAELQAQGVTIIDLPHGVRLVGLHGDITVSDLSEITPPELARMSRIRT